MGLIQEREGTDLYPGGSKSYVFPCDCGDHHYIRIDRDGDFADVNYFEIDDHYRGGSLWERSKTALKILLNKDCPLRGVVLTQDVANQIIEALAGEYPEPDDIVPR